MVQDEVDELQVVINVCQIRIKSTMGQLSKCQEICTKNQANSNFEGD